MKTTIFRRSFCSAAVFCLIAVAAPVSAGIKFFYDRASFEAEISGLPTEDFEAATIGPGQSASFGPLLDSFTDNQYFSRGSVLPGFALLPTFEVFLGGDGFRSNPTKHVSSSVDDPYIFLRFPRGVSAVGMDLRGFDGAPGDWLVLAEGGPLFSQLGSSDAWSKSEPCLLSTVPCGFIGVLSTDRILQLVLRKPASGGVIDNLTFGNPVP